MSFLPFHPSRLGLIIPEDLLTGVYRPDRTFSFDGVIDWSAEDPTTVARHPVERGKKAVTDARLKADPRRMQATFLLTDTPEAESPYLPIAKPFTAPDRCVRRFADFERFAAANDPVTVSVPGKSLRRMAIGTVRDRPHPNGVGLLVDVQFEELRIVTLRTGQQIPDTDLAAAGFGGGGASGSTFVEVGVFGGG